MDWKRFFKLMFLNLFLVPLVAALILGLIGYSAKRGEGFLNGATWGIALGVISLPFGALALMMKYWEGYTSRFGAWYCKEEPSENKTRN
ncbi:MAG TPA: hypothetical protein PKL78_05570 [Anaerolineales bacterium]|nr:hypothetical protein [Anaerolineales bacterium]